MADECCPMTVELASCPLADLAAYLRDGDWIDIRTTEGPIRRVRIVEIIVRVESDAVVLRQDWLDHDASYHRESYVLDAEDIWRAELSSVEIWDVKPWRCAQATPPAAPPKGKLQFGHLSAEQSQLRLVTITTEAARLFGLPSPDLLADGGGYLPIRYVTMLAAYEMTDVSPSDITRVFGYTSQMPLQSARLHIEREQCGLRAPHSFINQANVRKLAAAVDRAVGMKARTTRGFSRNYRQVLT